MTKLLMDKYLFVHPDGSAKVWFVHYANGVMTTRWGKEGAALQEHKKPCTFQDHRNTVESKRAKGYVLTGETPNGDEEGVGNMPNASPAATAQVKSAAKDFDAALYWIIDKKSLDMDGFTEEVKSFIGIVDEVDVNVAGNVVMITVEKSVITIDPNRASISGSVKIENWKEALVLFRIAKFCSIQFSTNSVAVENRNALRDVFQNPDGFEDFSEQLGLVPKISDKHREIMQSFF